MGRRRGLACRMSSSENSAAGGTPKALAILSAASNRTPTTPRSIRVIVSRESPEASATAA